MVDIAGRVARKLAGQVASFDTRTALVLARREVNASARLELPGAAYAASRDDLARLDRTTVAACWPQLAAVLAGAREPTPAAATPTAPSTGMQRYEAQRAQMAERHRANREAAQARADALQVREEAINAGVAARAEATRRQQAELALREREEAARELARQQQARADQERERQADLVAARARADALQAEAAAQRVVSEREAAVERERQARQIREQQETLARAQSDAQARYATEAQSRQLTTEIDRLDTERRTAAQAAERAKRPECRESDRVAQEEAKALQKAGITVPDIAVKLSAGMRVEACAAARRAFTAAEHMRVTAARCELLEAIPFNQLASELRDLILDQGC
ncbi:hypothetical protein MKK84_06690 [Methylobacterium sp. E-065]|uniref:hypothetical protein n=1 Tax=Methylobacterium sp. E-065 TaxID=2836583 RepID=UPI001FBA8065|nr:hypothetical protein [Methylobacterium sp. E-065]MCJ2017114.1 hypothetical protein [Methylobacterium sp. E-065]